MNVTLILLRNAITCHTYLHKLNIHPEAILFTTPLCVCMCNQVDVIQCRSKTLKQTATVEATAKKWR